MAPSKKFLQPINLLNAASDPVSADTGDFYYNTTSEKIRYYDGTQWNDVGTGSGGGVTVSETAPTATAIGEGWFKSSTSELFIWDGTYWVEATSTVESMLLFTVGETAPSSPIEGQGWFDNVGGDFYIYDGTYWQQVVRTVTVDLVNDTTPQLGGDLDANGFGLDNVEHIGFDPAAGYSVGLGEMAWDTTYGTLDIGMNNGSVLQVGQEIYYSVFNDTGSTIADGTVVYASGIQGDHITVAPAIADGSIPARFFLGVVTSDIPAGGIGYVTYFGKVSDVTGTVANGTVLYASTTTAGEFQTTEPEAPNLKLPIGFVVRQHGQNMDLMIRMNNGAYLNDMHNVQITSVADNDIIAYNSTTERWENTPVPVSLPDQTGHSGEFLTTDGTNASWTTVSASGGGTSIATDVSLSNSWWLGV